jgi:hypothetical protein
MLVESAPVERIVTSMVVWSQIGIAPVARHRRREWRRPGHDRPAGGVLAAGMVTLSVPSLAALWPTALGFAYLGLVPATAGLLVLGFLRAPGSRVLREAPP